MCGQRVLEDGDESSVNGKQWMTKALTDYVRTPELQSFKE